LADVIVYSAHMFRPEHNFKADAHHFFQRQD